MAQKRSLLETEGEEGRELFARRDHEPQPQQEIRRSIRNGSKLPLHVQQQAARVLHNLLDALQEGHRLPAVDQAVVVRQRQVHDGPAPGGGDVKGRGR